MSNMKGKMMSNLTESDIKQELIEEMHKRIMTVQACEHIIEAANHLRSASSILEANPSIDKEALIEPLNFFNDAGMEFGEHLPAPEDK